MSLFAPSATASPELQILPLYSVWSPEALM
jgi:hypothetical protein